MATLSSYDNYLCGFQYMPEDQPTECEGCGNASDDLIEVEGHNPFENGIPDGTIWLCRSCRIERGYIEEEDIEDED